MSALAYGALWIFIFSIPWENVVVVAGVGAISRLMGMLALGFVLLAVVVSGRFRRWHVLHVAALLFLMWAGSGQLFRSIDRLSFKFLTYVQLVLVLWMIWELAPSRHRQIGLLTAYVLGAYVAAFNTVMVYRREVGILRRFAAQGFDPNELAMILALALPMAWYLGMTYRRALLRWLFRAYVPICLLAVGLTGSRGGMLAVMVALLVIPLTMTKLSAPRLAAVIVVVGISGAVAIAHIPETALTRLATTGSAVEGGGLGGRLRIWSVGVRAFSQRPLTGYGTGSFKAVVAPWLGREAQVAHNSYLSVLVETGVIGFVFFAAMFVAVFLALLGLPRLERRFALVLFATLAVAMLPLSWEDGKSVWFILAALLGLSKAYPAETGDNVEPSSERRPTPLAGPGARSHPWERLTAPTRSTYREGRA